MQDSTTPLISVVSCTRNRLAFVARHYELLKGILPQRVELLYALDHCTDGTRDFLEGVCKANPQIRFAENTGTPGLFSCRNFAIDVAKGQYIHYLDDDDTVCADFYTTLLGVIDRSQGAGLIVTDLIIGTQDAEPYRQEIVKRDRVKGTRIGHEEHFTGDLFLAILQGHLYFYNGNVLINKRLFHTCRYHADIRKTADWLLYLEMALRDNLTIVYAPQVSATYFVHPMSMSISPDKPYWNMRAFERLFGMMPSDHSHRPAVKLVYARALFDAGFATRMSSRRKAFGYYVAAMRQGLIVRPLTGIMKLLVPKTFVRSRLP